MVTTAVKGETDVKKQAGLLTCENSHSGYNQCQDSSIDEQLCITLNEEFQWFLGNTCEKFVHCKTYYMY